MIVKRVNPGATYDNAQIWTELERLCCEHQDGELLCAYSIEYKTSSFIPGDNLLSGVTTAYSIDGTEYLTSNGWDLSTEFGQSGLISDIEKTLTSLGFYAAGQILFKKLDNGRILFYTAYSSIKLDYIINDSSQVDFIERCCEGGQCPTESNTIIEFIQESLNDATRFTVKLTVCGPMHCNIKGAVLELYDLNPGPPISSPSGDLILNYTKTIGDKHCFELPGVVLAGVPVNTQYFFFVNFYENPTTEQGGGNCPQLDLNTFVTAVQP